MKSGSAPPWARELALRVCTDAGVAPPDVLRWRRADRELSTGLTRRHTSSIAVTAGRDPDDARHTLLHELGHWLAPESPRRRGRRRQVVHHGREYYAVALDLYARHDPDPVAALRREANRYPSCLRHARALGMAGVDGLVLEHRRRRGAVAATRGHWRILVPEHSVHLARDGRWYVCATCGRRMVGRVLRRAARGGSRERHTLWTREPLEAAG
jgi:hypothetical protein